MAARKAQPKPKTKRKPPETAVVAAVKRDLAEIKKRDPELAKSGLAASALAIARDLDNPKNSATSRSMCARALLDTLDRLRELAPAKKENDELDDLSARREKRLKRAAGAKA